MTIDLPPAPNPEAITSEQIAPEPVIAQAETVESPVDSITKAEPDVAKPNIVEPTVPGSTTVAEMIPELQLIDQIWSSYREQLAASIEQQAAAVELDEYQKKYNAACEKTEAKKSATKELLSSFLDRLAAIRDPNTVAMVEQIRESVDTIASDEPKQLDWETYLAVSTQVILDQKIEGLGPKKAEKLRDEFPTIKHLMDAKTEASKECVHFCKKLTKGFGEVIADKITEVMDDILFCKIPIEPIAPKEPVPKKFRVKPASEATEPEPLPEGEPGGLTEEDFSDEPEGILGNRTSLDVESIDIDPDSDDWKNPHDDDSIIYADADDESSDEQNEGPSWAETYLDAIRKDPAQVQSTWGANEKKHSSEWQKGHDAQESFPVDACPFNENTPEAKEWIRGYCAADALAMDL